MEIDKLSPDARRAMHSLEGLAMGDAFGEMFFFSQQENIARRVLPEGPWRWTDDTHMALSVVEVLLSNGEIDQDLLARLFSERYMREPMRGYGPGAHRLLARYAEGVDWRVEASAIFEGGSYGNGAAMRVAPVGAYFAGDPKRAAVEARKSAQITHAHIEGEVGAMAVAVAGSIFTYCDHPPGNIFLREVIDYLPATRTRDRLELALDINASDNQLAIEQLGTGSQIAAFDTVPYCLWVVANHAIDFETALWQTVAGLGDRDTTCAIVGGIVGQIFDFPQEWLARREALPPEFSVA